MAGVNVEREGASVRVPPPAVFVGFAILGAAGDRYIGHLPSVIDVPARTVIAVALGLVGVLFMVGAMRLFVATGQDPKPWKPSPELIAAGIYRVSRNPMYISMALFQATIGVATGNAWIVLLVPMSMATVHWTAIRHEEQYLGDKFGEAYVRYKRSIRRWL